MSFGYRSRPSRGNFRSPRGSSSRGSFRGRGRSSESHFRSPRGSRSSRGSRGLSFSSRPGRSSSYRGGSFKGSSFHERDDYYDSRSSGSKYSHERYGSSRGRKDDDSYQHRESSGSFGREHSRRSDFEPERKRMKSEIGHYKEGASPRRGYDDIEHSSRGYNSSPSSYHGDSSPFKSHKKDYGEFKKPLPVEREFSSRRPNRAIRSRGSRGGISRTFTKTIKPLMSSSIKRIGTGRINKISSATRLQLLLRRKKQLRIMRLRRAREEREMKRGEPKREDTNDVLSEEEEEDIADEEMDNELKVNESKTSVESKKVATKEIKKEPKSDAEETPTDEAAKPKEETSPPAKGLHKKHITLKCIHCKTEFRTFKVYIKHLQNYKHKKAMETLVYRLKQKLNKMRNEQRDQQRQLDDQCEDFARTSYCKLCKLNYKQTRQEHYTSDFHVTMSEFLNPKCALCCMTFQTPILYEHHRCTLAHIKRKASQMSDQKGDQEMDDDNNDEDNFMVLDSVGSADESNDENEEDDTGKAEDKEVSKTKKKDSSKIAGDEYIEKVTCYYCKLCAMCLRYSPKINQDELLLRHCRTRFHLKRYSMDQSKKQQTKLEDQKETENESTSLDNSEIVEPEEQEEKLWTDENCDGDHKLSEDEEDSKSNIRYDRFGHSDEKENLEKQKTNSEPEAIETVKTEEIEE